MTPDREGDVKERVARELHRMHGYDAFGTDVPWEDLHDSDRYSYLVDADRILAALDTPQEPVAWMIEYDCGCLIPCSNRVTDTFCPLHDEEGPVADQHALYTRRHPPTDTGER